MSKLDCSYGQKCSGCQNLHLTYEDQAQNKVGDLKSRFSKFQIHFVGDIEFLSAGTSLLRDRLDFTYVEGCLGLYEKEPRHSADSSRQIVDIEVCQQLSPALQVWYGDFRRDFHPRNWPLRKASLRLRIGPQGQRGLWIDAANLDIKALLEEKEILRGLQKHCFVEIGQRRKVPMESGNDFKLRDPELNIWFQSWMGERPIDLFCNVASFTQPSLRANRLICDLLSRWISAFPSRPRILEFGSGIGNLSFAALAHARSLTACEIDSLSLEGFRKTLEQNSLEAKVQIHAGDFQKKLREDFSDFDLILCNPPRSGLMNFLKPLADLDVKKRPEYFIYMSCFPESLCQDLVHLRNLNYAVEKMTIVDQFPQTNHYEVLCLLKKIT